VRALDRGQLLENCMRVHVRKSPNCHEIDIAGQQQAIYPYFTVAAHDG
jgi:hypothetical protein